MSLAPANDTDFKVEDVQLDGKLDVKLDVNAAEAANAALERRKVVEKSLKRKLDARCSIFVLIYIMNYLDRNNIAAARLKGLQADLKLSDTQYATCLSVLYAGYILMQVPSNMIVNRMSRPSIYISCAMILWGLISVLSGVVTNFAGMVACRFFIGFVEAAFLPGALLLLSKWYTRRELTLRNAILFGGNLISNAFSGLLAAGILSNLDGVLGHAAWSWLFFIEGGITIFIAIIGAILLPDLPTNTRWFTEEELQVAQLRMAEDVGEADEDSSELGVFDGFLMAVKDFKVYVFVITLIAWTIGLSFNAFFPTLTATLGFGVVPTLLLSAPPWAFAVIVSMINAWHSDRTQEKFWHIVIPICFGIVGFVICMSTNNTAGRYIGLFLQTGSYAGYIVVWSWVASSFPRPPAKRAVVLAMVTSLSNLGSVAGSYVWNHKANGFRGSYGIVTAMFLFTIAGCCVIRTILVRLNKRLEAGESAWESRGDVLDRTRRMEALDGADEAVAMKAGFRYLI
ncbi:putative transporter [Vanrija pseudolonga]|uniref:Purtative transporter n=1 Tax=Vanrija pseudolonga TaxID=143232 RepID=A0AAF0YDV3_9TREE|nr:purtative transporter [Vanrija pseudolonga]